MIYAQLNELGYCIGVMDVGEDMDSPNLIKIDSFDVAYIGRKYDIINRCWTEEYFVPEVVVPELSEHEQITKTTSETVEVSSYDNIVNMDMLLMVDEKLDKILKHLGL